MKSLCSVTIQVHMYECHQYLSFLMILNKPVSLLEVLSPDVPCISNSTGLPIHLSAYLLVYILESALLSFCYRTTYQQIVILFSLPQVTAT